jgi:MOSC domain-containing protein YiiM
MSTQPDASPESTATRGTPRVTALHLSRKGQPSLGVERVAALLDRGLDGDRHARPGNRRSVLLVEHEVLDDLELAPGWIREQVTVRGLDLDRLVIGSRLRIGDAVLEIAEPCAPCEKMERIRAGLRKALVGRRGRFARVVQAGGFAVGDGIAIEPPR